MICHRCQSPTQYTKNNLPICFKCICRSEDFRMLDLIVGKVSELTGVQAQEIKSKRRDSKAIEARQICMYLVRSKTGLSFAEIGQYFHRDHATVMYSCKVIKGLVDVDIGFRDKIEVMKKATD